jgi:hypothetical protein
MKTSRQSRNLVPGSRDRRQRTVQPITFNPQAPQTFPHARADTRREMDALTSSIVGLKQAETFSRVQFAVAKKILDNQQLQGDAALKLINAAAGGAAKAGDALVAAATGLGGALDTYG